MPEGPCYTMSCPPVGKIIHSLKLVDYLHVQADNPWYNEYLETLTSEPLFCIMNYPRHIVGNLMEEYIGKQMFTLPPIWHWSSTADL